MRSASSRQGPSAKLIAARFAALLSIAAAVAGAGMLCAVPAAFGASVSVSATTLTYRAGPNEQNKVTVSQQGSDYVVTDEGVVALGDSTGTCTALQPNSLSCPAPATPAAVPVTVNLGDGDDTATVDGPLRVSLSGREGNDVLTGGSAQDIFDAGPGDDRLVTADGIAEIVKCGAGTDRYSSDAADVTSDCEDDGVPPETTIDSMDPRGPVLNPGGKPITFTFSAIGPATSFTCRLNDQTHPGCDSPFSTGLLDEGSYTFGVAATDQYGNADPSEATASFRIDLTPPNTTFTSGPADITDTRTPTFGLASSEDPAAFDCEIDDGPIIECQNPFTLPALENGTHRFRAWARDAAGNADPTGAARSFIVAASSPVPTKAQQQPVVIVLGSIVLISGRTVKMSKAGTVPVSLSCAGSRVCKGTMVLASADPVRVAARKIAKLGKARFRIKPQHKKLINVRLSKKARKLVKRLRRLRTRATIREVDLRGNPRISSREFTLRK